MRNTEVADNHGVPALEATIADEFGNGLRRQCCRSLRGGFPPACRSCSVSFAATRRAVMSGPVPGALLGTILITRAEYRAAADPTSVNPAARTAKTRSSIIPSLPE